MVTKFVKMALAELTNYYKAMEKSCIDYSDFRKAEFAKEYYKNPIEGTAFRLSLKVKTKALIALDRKQIELAETLRANRNKIYDDVRSHVREQFRSQNQSAWFSGNPGEKSFY
jgi:hypothetical protein